MQYDYRENKRNFTGSIAGHFADELRKVAEKKKIEIKKIENRQWRD
jgi:hypothetical protein